MTENSSPLPDALDPEQIAALDTAQGILDAAAARAVADFPAPAPEPRCDFCGTPFRFCAAYIKGDKHSLCSYCVQASLIQLGAALGCTPAEVYTRLEQHHNEYQVKFAAELYRRTHTDEVLEITGPKS